MHIEDIQTALAAIRQHIGGRCVSTLTVLMHDDGNPYTSVGIYPDGMTAGGGKRFEASNYSTVTDMMQDAQDYAAGYRAMKDASQVDDVALSIINIHYAKRHVTMADLIHKHGPSVADCALTAVARANERLNTATPISIGA